MEHPSNKDLDKLHELICEMEKVIFKYSPDRDMDYVKVELSKAKGDVAGVQDIVVELAKVVYDLTPSSFLKGVVNSVLDSMSVDEALSHLKAFNKQRRLSPQPSMN